MSLWRKWKLQTHQIMNSSILYPISLQKEHSKAVFNRRSRFQLPLILQFHVILTAATHNLCLYSHIHIHTTGHIKQNRTDCAPHFLSCSAMAKKFSFEQQASCFMSRSSPPHSLMRLSRFYPTSYINCTLDRALHAKGKQHVFFLGESWWV